MSKRSIRRTCLVAALTAAGVPALAAAQTPARSRAVQQRSAPTTAPAKPAPAPAAAQGPAAQAPADAPTAEGGGTGLIVLVAIGGLVLLGGGFLAWRMVSGGGGGRREDPLLPERKHDWELKLTEEQERALLKGIEAFRDGGQSLLFYHREAMIRFYGPNALVSMHKVSDAFLAAGPAGMADPAGTVRSLLQGLLAGESPGVLRLKDDWYAPPIDGLDNLQFTNLCYDVLTCPRPYLDGTQGSGCDEGTGVMELHLEVGAPLNTFCVDLSRVLAEVHKARAARPGDPLIELVRPVLRAMCRGEIPGGMWMRGAGTPAEIDLVERIVATSAPRAS